MTDDAVRVVTDAWEKGHSVWLRHDRRSGDRIHGCACGTDDPLPIHLATIAVRALRPVIETQERKRIGHEISQWINPVVDTLDTARTALRRGPRPVMDDS